MSEVDRLSNSGLYPALPISDKRRDGQLPAKPPPPESRDPGPSHEGEGNPDPHAPRTPKSIIDEYA